MELKRVAQTFVFRESVYITSYLMTHRVIVWLGMGVVVVVVVGVSSIEKLRLL